MAKRLFTTAGISFAATASGGTVSSGNYMSVVGASGTQVTDILEVLVSGMASASTLGGFLLDRQSTLGTGGATTLASPNSDGPMNPATAALAAPVVTAIAYATNQPTASNAITDARINLCLNGFGGILRWNAAPTQQYTISGNTAPGGSAILFDSSSTGGVTCAASAHIMYETY